MTTATLTDSAIALSPLPDVLARIRAGDPAWIPLVPPSVAARIQSKQLFGHPGDRSTGAGPSNRSRSGCSRGETHATAGDTQSCDHRPNP